MNAAGLVLLYLGIVLTLIGVVGLFRFSDIYSRVKAASLVTFPAAILIHAASALLVPFENGWMRGWITAFFFLVSGPVLSHVIIRAAHISGAPQGHTLDDPDTAGTPETADPGGE